ncbi:hypothetical protein HBH99_217220 [Parastagonospora nodorum]|nr:hypothetical protein HBH99_217220 [Parastagonospora nodorum]
MSQGLELIGAYLAIVPLALNCFDQLRLLQDGPFQPNRIRHKDIRPGNILLNLHAARHLLKNLAKKRKVVRRYELSSDEEKTPEDLEREERLDRLERLYKWYIRFVQFLEKLFKALMFICAFSVFPNEHRPPCKTMPWDIIPSLVVLWGVCWMFYNPANGTQTEEDYETSVDNIFLNFPHGSMAESFSHQLPFSTYENDQDWDWSHGDFGYIADRLHPWATPSEVGLLPSASEPMSSFGIDKIPEVFTVQSTDSDDGQILAGHGIASAMPRNEFSTETYGATGQFDTGHRQHAPPPVPSRRPSTSGELAQVAYVSQPLGLTTLSTLPRRLQPQWRCDRTCCNGKTFRTQSAWKTHMNKHDRPFTCDIPGCSRTEGYGTKGELQRHQKTHRSHLLQEEALSSNDICYYCPEPNCDRSNKPFARKDNRDDHIKRKHPNHPARHLFSKPRSSSQPENANGEFGLAIPQQPSPAAIDQPSVGKRKRLECNEPICESSSSTCDICGSLQAEISTLKRRVTELEDKLRSSKEKAETLSEVIRGGWNR